jgi:hypothetical protein
MSNSLSIKSSLCVNNQTFNVVSISILGVRYTNCKQYAAFLQISEPTESRKTHEIKSVKFSDLFQGGGISPPLEGSIKDSLLSALGIKSNNLDESLWLKDREVIKWTLKAKTAFAKEFTDHVVDIFMEKTNSVLSRKELAKMIYEAEIAIEEANIAKQIAEAEAERQTQISDEKTRALNETIVERDVLTHKVDTHIQIPKNMPNSTPAGVYTQSEIEDEFKGFLSLQSVLNIANYMGHPTTMYRKEIITKGRSRTPFAIIREFEAYTKEVNLDDTVISSFFPNNEKKEEYKHTCIRFTVNSFEIWKHPASQNKIIRIPKKEALVFFNSFGYVTLKPSTFKDLANPTTYYSYLQFIYENGAFIIID